MQTRANPADVWSSCRSETPGTFAVLNAQEPGVYKLWIRISGNEQVEQVTCTCSLTAFCGEEIFSDFYDVACAHGDYQVIFDDVSAQEVLDLPEGGQVVGVCAEMCNALTQCIGADPQGVGLSCRIDRREDDSVSKGEGIRSSVLWSWCRCGAGRRTRSCCVDNSSQLPVSPGSLSGDGRSHRSRRRRISAYL